MPDGRQMIELVLGEYSWETFSDAEKRVSHLAAGLYSMAGSQGTNSPIAIFSETRAEWLYATLAAFRLNRPVVTLYATLGDEALIHGFNQSEVKFLCGSFVLLYFAVMCLLLKCLSLRYFVH